MGVQSAQCEQLSCHGFLVMRGIQQLNGLRAVLELCPAMKSTIRQSYYSKKGDFPNFCKQKCSVKGGEAAPQWGMSLWHFTVTLFMLDRTFQATGKVPKMSPNFWFITWFWLIWKSSGYCNSILNLFVWCTGNWLFPVGFSLFFSLSSSEKSNKTALSFACQHARNPFRRITIL